MQRIIPFITGALFLAILPAPAALDIVHMEGKSAWVVEDTESGKVLGTFWDPAEEKSDYGFSSGNSVVLFWSKDRSVVAANSRDNNGRLMEVYIYQVGKKTLHPIAVPQLTDEQAGELKEVQAGNLAYGGTEAIRWQRDGTLLLHFFGADRVTSETEKQKVADVWADVEVADGEAKIVGTSTVEPAASAATNSSLILGQGDSGEQPPDDSAPVFQFDGAKYYLRGDEAGIREYLTQGETFETWSTLISVREFHGTDNPKAYAQKLVENARASGENAKGQLLENDAAGSYIADFIVFSEEGADPSYAEWNLWRVEKKGDGVEAVQYARRFYKITEDTAKELISEREKIVPLLAEFETPN